MFEIAAHQQPFRAPDMAGLINKINRSLISPMPIVYSSTLKQIIKSMLRKSPEHRPTAADLLRHPHLQPFLLRSHNPSIVFLPMKSPSPNNIKEKTKKVSPGSYAGRKDSKTVDTKIKPREFSSYEENTNNYMQYMSLLDDFVLMEEKLETKRVDPTSYSGHISHDSENSKPGDTSTACDVENLDSLLLEEGSAAMVSLAFKSKRHSKEQEKHSPGHATKLDNTKIKANDRAHRVKGVSIKDNMQSTEGTVIMKVDSKESTRSLRGDEIACGFSVAPHDEALSDSVNEAQHHGHLLYTTTAVVSDQSKGECENPKEERADALESLLELCARLLKQDKFDELSGVLKPFGDGVVSSRETAIWLTKSLMNNAQKFTKEE